MRKTLDLIRRNQLIVFVFLLVLYLLLFSPGLQNSEKEIKSSTINVLPLVMRYVNRYYVDQSAINPKAMLTKGLEKLERTLDEVVVDFPQGKNSPFFRVQVMGEEKTFDMKRVNDLYSVADRMEEVFQFITPRLTSREPKAIDVEYAVTDEILKTLDPYSGIITPQVYQEFTIETEGSFGGLGIVIGIRDEQLTVIAPIEGTPAYRAGIKPNDRIVQIEDESTVNMSLIEAVGKLRGPKGTAVNIYIQREGFPEPKRFSIVRDMINIESVEAFNLSDGIVYAKIRDFQKNTLSSLRESLKGFKKSGNLKGLILDLRGNPGGLLDQAERISDLFLKSGVIVTTEVGNSKKPYYAKHEDYDFNGRIVVLVDSGSASASEIVAGAIKNNERGVLVGERTFGKGSVQQIFDLNDGSALKLTIAHYLTPGDISIQDVGITPDIRLQPAVISKDVIPSSSENNHGGKSNGKRVVEEKDKPIYSISYLETSESNKSEDEQTPEEALSREERRKKLENDFYVALAKEIILSSTSSSRKEILSEAKDRINLVSKEEERKIEEKWQEMGIDWSLDGTASGTPNISVRVSPEDLKVRAGEKSTVSVEVENTGTIPTYRLTATAKSDDPIFDGKELVFGKLNPGEKRNRSFPFEIPKWSLTREDEVTLQFKDAYNSNLPDFKFKVEIEGLPRPVFAFNYEIVDDGRYESSGNGDGIPEVGETIGLLVRLKNIGKGVSEEGVLAIKNLSGDKVFLKRGRVNFKNLSPGEVKEETLIFTVQKPDPNINMELQVLDEVYREGLTSKIQVPEKDKGEGLISKPLNVVVLKDGAPIRGGSFVEAPVIGVSKKGAIFKTIGEREGWLKINLKDHLTGWIKKEDVLLTNLIPNPSDALGFTESFEEPPSIDIVTPPLSTGSQEVDISGVIKDEDGVRLVSVFVGDDKVKLLPSTGREVPVSLKVKLNDGINLITVFAKDSAGLFFKETFVVRKEGLKTGSTL